MEESKFLEAQRLKNEISYLENCLEDSKRKDAKICISWPELVTQSIPTSITSGIQPCSTTYYTENHIEALPKNLEEQVIELIQDELDKLKQEFKLL